MTSGPLAGCRVLAVDDEPTILLPLRDSLTEAGAEVTTAANGNQAATIIAERAFDIVVSDVRMPGLNGLELLARVKSLHPRTEVVLITAFANVENAVAAIKAGAYDFVVKPFADEALLNDVANAWAMVKLRREVAELRERGNEPALGFLVGQSEPWRALVDRVRTVAGTDATVLVVGASGTGKELIARAVHELSPRSAGPFVKLHCAALPVTLMESELFGHVKGAFTGALAETKGRFELAQGGTLLLDEVDEIPIEIQVKLLRVIQERVIERVGSGRPVPVNVRLVATSKGRLQELVNAGRFRSDLLYRLSVVQLELPELRHRAGDVPLLLEHFLRRFGTSMPRGPFTLTPEAHTALLAYDYPGNVRELEHIVEAACAQSADGAIGPALLPPAVASLAARPAARVGMAIRPLAEVMAELERSYLEHAVREFNGSRTALAELLGISRKSLWQKLKAYGIDPSDSD